MLNQKHRQQHQQQQQQLHIQRSTSGEWCRTEEHLLYHSCVAVYRFSYSDHHHVKVHKTLKNISNWTSKLWVTVMQSFTIDKWFHWMPLSPLSFRLVQRRCSLLVFKCGLLHWTQHQRAVHISVQLLFLWTAPWRGEGQLAPPCPVRLLHLATVHLLPGRWPASGHLLGWLSAHCSAFNSANVHHFHAL